MDVTSSKVIADKARTLLLKLKAGTATQAEKDELLLCALRLILE